MSSDTVIEPAASPASVVTVSSMSRAFLRLLNGSLSAFGCRLLIGGCAEFSRLGRILRQRLLDRVAHHDPAALRARNRALDQDEAAFDIGLHHAQIERGHALDTHLPRHLLVLEGLARILTAAGRTDGTVRDRDAVRGAQATEIPPLHATGVALADRRSGHINKLTDDEMIGGDFRPNRDDAISAHAELRELALGLDLRDREVAA